MFVAVEGGDGAGKGTVVAALAAELQGRGRTVLTTREPGGTPEGQRLREILLAADGTAWEPWAELLLVTAARVQHVARVIRPALARGEVVISDRFAGSTIAYQGAGRGLSVDAIRALHRDAVGDFWPDLTVVLDVTPELGIRRSKARLHEAQVDEGRFEALELGFHERVRQSFLQQAEAAPARFAVIDAGQPPDAVARAVIAAVRSRLA